VATVPGVLRPTYSAGARKRHPGLGLTVERLTPIGKHPQLLGLSQRAVAVSIFPIVGSLFVGAGANRSDGAHSAARARQCSARYAGRRRQSPASYEHFPSFDLADSLLGQLQFHHERQRGACRHRAHPLFWVASSGRSTGRPPNELRCNRSIRPRQLPPTAIHRPLCLFPFSPLILLPSISLPPLKGNRDQAAAGRDDGQERAHPS